MRLVRTVFLILCGWVAVAEVSSAAEMDLNSCIELALKTRASIIQARSAEELARASTRSALGAFLPTLNANFSLSESKTTDRESGVQGQPKQTLDDVDASRSDLTLSSDLSLINVSNFHSYAAARAAQAAYRLDVLDTEQQLIYAVKLAYYAHLSNVENVAVQEEAVKRSEEQLKLIDSKFSLGSASKSDVLKQRVNLGRDRLELSRAKNAVVNSRANLAYTIGLDPMSDVQFATAGQSREFDGSIDDAITFALAKEPGLLAAEHNERAARHDLGAARSTYLPTLSGFGNYSMGSSTFTQFVEGDSGSTALVSQVFESSDNSLTFGLSANWNIFDGFFRERSIVSAKVSRNNARAALADARNLVVQNVKSAYLSIQELRQQRDVATDNVEAAQEDLKITREKYNLGAATILDLLDAQVSLKRAEVDLVRANFDLNVVIAELENAMGKP